MIAYLRECKEGFRVFNSKCQKNMSYTSKGQGFGQESPYQVLLMSE